MEGEPLIVAMLSSIHAHVATVFTITFSMFPFNETLLASHIVQQTLVQVA